MRISLYDGMVRISEVINLTHKDYSVAIEEDGEEKWVKKYSETFEVTEAQLWDALQFYFKSDCKEIV